jgi:hypothetical protein
MCLPQHLYWKKMMILDQSSQLYHHLGVAQ